MFIGMIADSFGIMYNMAFTDLRLDSDSKGTYCMLRMYIRMLNKNTLSVKKCEANQKPQWLYKRPKTLISSKAKKLNILLRIFSLE